jgi:hypothetical protein
VSVLVAFDDGYRSYRGAIAAAIRGRRPGAEVAVAEPGALRREVSRLDPDLVIYDGQGVDEPDGRRAWFELPTDPTLPAIFRVGARRSVCLNPGLRELLSAVDEARRIAASTPVSAATPGATASRPC